MAQSRCYTPQLERSLVTALYHAAKARRIPMTRLASLLMHEGLEGERVEASLVREASARADPPS
jgi:hypothetical protein